MFRKRASEFQSEDDAIPEDLLANIPDIDANAAEAGSDDGYAEEAQAAAQDKKAEGYAWTMPNAPANGKSAPAAKAPAPAGKGNRAPKAETAPDVHALVAEVRRQMEQVVGRELGKVEDTFAGTLHQMQERLSRSASEIASLKEANESLLRAKVEYERKIDALKQLTKTISDL